MARRFHICWAVCLVGTALLAGILPALGQEAGSFQWVGDLGGGGIGAQATLMPDGMVLITGGVGVSGPIAEEFGIIVLFDPRTNGLVSVNQRTAVPLPDGRVLVVGGSGYSPCKPAPSQDSAEIFVPTSAPKSSTP